MIYNVGTYTYKYECTIFFISSIKKFIDHIQRDYKIHFNLEKQ